MKELLILPIFLIAIAARPEPPLLQKFEKFLPLVNGGQEFATQEKYGPPPKPVYGPPKPVYGPPKPVYGPPPADKIITKNVYIHVPPEEPVEYLPSQPIQVPPPKKHYKIIFIKAPEPPKPTVPIIPLQPQDEHKTLVYVLVKKPEEQPEINIPLAEPTEPTKPEVYFIKYKHAQKPAPSYGPPKPIYGPPGKPH